MRSTPKRHTSSTVASHSRARLMRQLLNMIAAVLFVTLGLLIPLSSAINQWRWERVEVSRTIPDLQAEIQARATQGLPVIQVTREEDTALPATVSAGVELPSLIPIVSTPIAPTTSNSSISTPASASNAIPARQSRPGPILMYHYIRSVDYDSDPLGYELSIAPELFDEHMRWLKEQGYTGVSLETWLFCTGRIPAQLQQRPCPAAPVALSFDDGYQDAYTDALPVLQRYGFQATFYIVSDFVGQPGYMGWEELAALRDAGMEIGSHSVSHPDLTQLDQAELDRQITQSKADIEAHLRIQLKSFCYPSGRYDQITEEAVRKAGFEHATTTRWDNDDSDLLALPRRRIAGATTVEELGWIVTQ